MYDTEKVRNYLLVSNIYNDLLNARKEITSKPLKLKIEREILAVQEILSSCKPSCFDLMLYTLEKTA